MHKQAAINTAKILGTGLAISIISFIVFQFMSTGMILTVFGVGCLAYMVNIIYGIEKTRLEIVEMSKKDKA